MKKQWLKTLILLLILVLASFLIFFRLDLADPLTDEVEISFRALGWLDFLATPSQTTPYEWFNPIPAWAKFSFHDHPPLTFAVEHLIFKIFPDSLFYLKTAFCNFWHFIDSADLSFRPPAFQPKSGLVSRFNCQFEQLLFMA